jgi:hypothetical protein
MRKFRLLALGVGTKSVRSGEYIRMRTQGRGVVAQAFLQRFVSNAIVDSGPARKDQFREFDARVTNELNGFIASGYELE